MKINGKARKKPWLLLGLLSWQGWAFSQEPVLTIQPTTIGKVNISWQQSPPKTKQLGIQISTDSLEGYKIIRWARNPQLSPNGFEYSLPTTGKWFFRVFYVAQDGKYFFTAPQSFEHKAMALQKAKPNGVIPPLVYANNCLQIQLPHPMDAGLTLQVKGPDGSTIWGPLVINGPVRCIENGGVWKKGQYVALLENENKVYYTLPFQIKD